MKKVVVTGGAGFIGAHLVKTFVDENYEVHVVDNLWSSKRENIPQGAIFHEIDIRDTAALVPVFKDAHAVFHLAACPRVPYSVEHPQEANDVNVNGTLSVLVAARDSKVARVIYAASSAAYGEQTTLPLVETMTSIPVNPYGLQKCIGEQYARLFAELYGLSTVSLRYFNVYGSGMDPEGGYALAIPKFLMLRSKNETLPITGDGTQTRDFTHIRDVVRANLLAMESPNVGKGEVINIGTGHAVSMNHLADLIGGEHTYIPARQEAKDTRADIQCAKKLLSWEPTVTLEEGIRELKQEWNII